MCVCVCVCIYFCSRIHTWNLRTIGYQNGYMMHAQYYVHTRPFFLSQDCPEHCGDPAGLEELSSLTSSGGPGSDVSTAASGSSISCDKLKRVVEQLQTLKMSMEGGNSKRPAVTNDDGVKHDPAPVQVEPPKDSDFLESDKFKHIAQIARLQQSKRKGGDSIKEIPKDNMNKPVVDNQYVLPSFVS